MARILRDHWRPLLAGGLVIFIPVGLIETIDADLQASVGDADDLLSVIEVFAVALLHAAGALLGQILYAGLVSALAIAGPGPGSGLVELGRELPIKRLILADIVFVLLVTAGFIAFVIPGVLFVVWFALIGPVIEVEHAGIRRSLRRSRSLVRKRFWLVASFVLPITLAEGVLGSAVHDASIWSLGSNFVAEWVAGTVATLIASTLLALAVTVLYLELSGAAGD